MIPRKILLATAYAVLAFAFSHIDDADKWCRKGTLSADGETLPFHSVGDAAKRSSSSALAVARMGATPEAARQAGLALSKVYSDTHGNITDEILTYDEVVQRWSAALKLVAYKDCEVAA